MHKYAVYGNEEITPLQVAKENNLNQEECIMCYEGRKQAEKCKKINPYLIIIGPERECDLCKGHTCELIEVRQRGSIAGDGEILICDYCYHSTGGIFYNYQASQDLMRHINNMFNLFEKRIKSGD